MCGINGILNFDDKPVDRADLAAMNSAMIHRGPDDEGFYYGDHAALAMRRLSIIDLDGGHQPISNEDGTLWIVLNGEIYNYIELRDELKARGHKFKTNTDVEVVLHLYEDMRESCLDKLNGMFAFSIWDNRSKELFIAVDRLGIKSLFYTKESSRFIFSSELRSLLKVYKNPSIDHDSYLLYLLLMYFPSPRSIVKGVFKVRPGRYLKIDRLGNIEERVYWSRPATTADSNVDLTDLKDRIVNLLKDSVRMQLRSDVPVGTFLSGGFDSSCVVALISMLGREDALNTFAVGYEGHYIDERPYALDVARKFKTKHTELFLTYGEVKNNLERIIAGMDEPMGDSAALPTFLLSGMARQAGVKVILNGTGGDEIFGGYPRYLRTGFIMNVRPFARAYKNVIMSLVKNPFAPATALKLGDGLLNYVAGIAGIRLSEFGDLMKDPGIFNRLLVQFEDAMRGEYDLFKGLGTSDRFSRFDIGTYLAGDLLPLLDNMTMAHSIEGRVPLLDHRVVELMASLPSSITMKGGTLKYIVKEAFRGKLPDNILSRGKMGFGAPVFSWLAKGLISEKIFDDLSPAASSLFDRGSLYAALKCPKSANRHNQLLYNIAIFEMWYRKNLA